MSKPKVIAIVGPTASGKTSLSIEIAKQFNGEVISADSRQVYRGMDIGSGKVTVDEMQGVPHHLLDIANPTEVYSAADFEYDASAATENILSRGRLPIFAGGTFFYLDVLRGKMKPAPVEPNPELRAALEAKSTDQLFTELSDKAPTRAASVDPENRRRLIRALEIYEVLGEIPEPTPSDSPYEWLLFGIDIPQDQRHHNIHARLHTRLQEGMVDEVRTLHQQGVSYTRLDEFGLEYRYVAKYLQGEITEPEMIDLIETKSRQFAKRQLTWLKRDKAINWVAPKDFDTIFTEVKDFLAA